MLMLEVGMAHRQLLYVSTIQDTNRGWILAVSKQLTRPSNFVPQAPAFLPLVPALLGVAGSQAWMNVL